MGSGEGAEPSRTFSEAQAGGEVFYRRQTGTSEPGQGVAS